MGVPEWMRYHNAQTLLNAEPYVREQLRAGTYEGREPIEDEYQLDQMVRGARREVEAARLFHFDNMSNSYDLDNYSVEPEDYFGECCESEEPEHKPWWKIW